MVPDALPCHAGVRTVRPPHLNQRLSALVDGFAVQRARTVMLQSFVLAGLPAVEASTAVAVARLGARRREAALGL
ncbi:hypothetical protein [Kitasatospora phosalacinea]|uniref:hypothetical protein n=1 Tax=Kitasatospora phosalacinea TaxID=2065 RepID=UPI000527383E|nr:hypothetical protein [Kitasatospora phosalacinea]